MHTTPGSNLRRPTIMAASFSGAARSTTMEKDPLTKVRTSIVPCCSTEFDNRQFVFTASTKDVSGKVKAIPDLPIVVIDHDEVSLSVAPRGSNKPAPEVVLNADDWTRWNDYGIGLLLQGDLKGARA